MLKPVQSQKRAIKTRQSLKTAFIEEITEKGYTATTIAAVAERASSSVGAFQNHFGTKKAALELFWGDYCDAVLTEIQRLEHKYRQRDDFEIIEFLIDISMRIAKHQSENVGLHQAMNLEFIVDKQIHLRTVEIMEKIVETIIHMVSTTRDYKISPMAARISTQILITLNLNYSLGGARLLPASPYERHKAIACAAATSIVKDH